jgi:hypothetical protein
LLLVLSFACALATSTLIAQRGPAPDPLVKENFTVKLGPHSYVIPDGNVGLVPNVGIVFGSRATLVIDPGLDSFLRAKSPMAVAETGSILLSDIELQVNTIPFLAHDPSGNSQRAGLESLRSTLDQSSAHAPAQE